MFASTDFRVRLKVLPHVLHAKLRVHRAVTVAANLHRFIYNVLNDIVFTIYFAIS